MTYKTIIIDDAPKAKKMAAAIEKTANKKAKDGWKLVTCSVTRSSKAILVFELPEKTVAAVKNDEAQVEKTQNDEVQIEEVLKDGLQEETAEAVSIEE